MNSNAAGVLLVLAGMVGLYLGIDWSTAVLLVGVAVIVLGDA